MAVEQENEAPVAGNAPASKQEQDALSSKELEGSSFEELMKERTRIRKEREEYSVAELRVRISRLEQALAAEVKRRVDVTHKLNVKASEEIQQMEERLQSFLDQTSTQVQQRLESMEGRLEVLEERLERDSVKQLDHVKSKGSQVGKLVEELKQEVEMEKKNRLMRETRFLQQLESHSDEFSQRWAQETQERTNSLQEVEQSLAQREKARAKQQSDFQARIQAELELLQSELQQEVMERQTQDEEIVTALDRYTQQLQQSLAILSGE